MFDYTQARQHMVDCQIRPSDVTSRDVLAAFKTVARENFIPKAKKALAYGDAHIEMADGRAVIRPRDFSKMVQLADIAPSDIVLDIACGRGYSTAILAQLAETVVGLEDDEGRVSLANSALTEAGITNAAIIEGELKDGAKTHGPFNCIFVNGAVSEVPQAWFDQLTDGGRLIAVVKNGSVGRCCIYTRSGETVGERVVFDASIPSLEGFDREQAFAL